MSMTFQKAKEEFKIENMSLPAHSFFSSGK
jgi:hypothetical protein